jgi:hypothetical protein
LKPSRNGNQRPPGWRALVLTDVNAVQIASIAGLLWLLAYTFTGWAREATLFVIWQMEIRVADLLGIAIRPSGGTAGPNEPVFWAAILGAYCLVSLWLIARTGRSMPAEDDLLETNATQATGWAGNRDSR